MSGTIAPMEPFPTWIDFCAARNWNPALRDRVRIRTYHALANVHEQLRVAIERRRLAGQTLDTFDPAARLEREMAS